MTPERDEPARRLDMADLDNIEAAALGRTGVGAFTHPTDTLRLVAEVRWYLSRALRPPYRVGQEVFPEVRGYDRDIRLGPDFRVIATYTEIVPHPLPSSSPKGDGGDGPLVVESKGD